MMADQHDEKAGELAAEYADEFVTAEATLEIAKALRGAERKGMERAAAICKHMARKHADKVIGEDTDEAELHRKAEAWMMLQCHASIMEQVAEKGNHAESNHPR